MIEMSTFDQKVAQPKPAHERFDFMGHHLIASYSGCDLERLNDTVSLLSAMREAITACGATLLNSCEHVFPNGSVTAVMLLSESHASIHTYPEHQSCFIDVFTCAETCDPCKFDEVMTRYLKPRLASRRILLRDTNNQEISSQGL